MFQLLPPFLFVLSLMMAINVSASEPKDIAAIKTTIMRFEIFSQNIFWNIKKSGLQIKGSL